MRWMIILIMLMSPADHTHHGAIPEAPLQKFMAEETKQPKLIIYGPSPNNATAYYVTRSSNAHISCSF